MTILIKRYANRKLYNTESSRYITLKGIAEPVQAWTVTGVLSVESRFQAARRVDLSPLVGRDEEITLLLNRWQRAKDGDGQVVLIVGEPGIGKSRNKTPFC